MWIALCSTVLVAAEPEPTPALDSLDEEFSALVAAERYTEAADVVRQTLALRSEIYGRRHIEVATDLNTLANVLVRDHQYEQARPVFEEALEIRRATHAPDVDVASTLLGFGMVLRSLGEYDLARTHLQESLDIARPNGGHPLLDEILVQLRMTHAHLQDFDKQREVQLELLAYRRATLGPRHSGVGQATYRLGTILKEMGELGEAEALLTESLEIAREVHGSRHRNVAAVLRYLAGILEIVGRLDEARELHAEALSIRRQEREKYPLRVAESLTDLGFVLMTEGDYSGARALYEEALDIQREVGNKAHIARSLQKLAELLRAQGDLGRARELYEESLALARAHYSPRHLVVAAYSGNLGLLLHAQGDFDAARVLFEENLSIVREFHDPRHARVANGLNNLARVHRAQGNYHEADALYTESLEITTEVHGIYHSQAFITVNNLAVLRWAMGEAETAIAMQRENLDAIRQAYGTGYPLEITVLQHLADFHRGDPEAERAYREQALEIVEGRLTLLDGLSEREALLYVADTRGALDHWLLAFERPADAEAAWEHVLRFKGAVAARARSARALATVEPEIAELADALDTVRQTLAEVAFRPRADQKTELDRLSEKRERLERELLSRSAHYGEAAGARGMTPAELCQALPSDGALIDLLRYGEHSPKYAAFVQLSGDCEVLRIDLGSAAELDAAALQWQEVLRQPHGMADRLDRRGRAVASLLLEPLSAVAGDRRHWLVVPDGPLATLPLAALPTGEGYLLEDHLVSYLDRAGDVLQPPRSGVATGAVVVGAVDYDAARRDGEEAASFLAPCNGGDFAALPGTGIEMDWIAKRWRRARHPGRPTLLTGAGATESVVAGELEGKALAHVATHGFFATGECRSAVENRAGYDPMLLSGLVLAGANRLADSASPGDGILTAAEVATCDLSATDLVVLSACETGLGEIESGQGVLGLRRAFAIAGARTLVMSLWAISDAETADLMGGMYRRHLHRRPLPAAEALREAQLEMLREQRESGNESPYAWAGFIASGDWRLQPPAGERTRAPARP